MKKEKKEKQDIEEKCLEYFEHVLAKLGMEADGRRHHGTTNKFDPFGLGDQMGFQYGDLRKNRDDRIVIVEVECACTGTLSNLAKFWPLARLGNTLPHLLLHVFPRPSRDSKDTSHLELWDFVWKDMKKELWSKPSTPQQLPKLFAKRFIYVRDTYEGMEEWGEVYRRCLTDDLEQVCREVFDWPGY